VKILKPSAEQISAFARRVISTLPDSIAAQKSELQVLVKILPHNTDARKAALEMLTALNLREQAQKEFCFTNGGTQ
jgi:hypothetical protein